MIPILSDRPGSQRCSTKNVIFFLLTILVAVVSGQEVYSQADLEAMSESELENICVERGFQLVEEAEGLTKLDYIEAAQRCLAIEQEMNELLTQYPELAEELEEEIKRMEKENIEKQADLERLQNELANSDSIDDNRSDSGTAFVRSGNGRGDGNDEIPPIEETDEANEGVESSSTTMDLDDMEAEEDAEDIDPSTTVETIESPRKEDLTLTHIAVESFRVLIKNAKDDVRRIINLAIPVLQPLFNVGDAAWRQMKDLFDRAREAYEVYQATNMAPDEAAETPETCEDDSAYS